MSDAERYTELFRKSFLTTLEGLMPDMEDPPDVVVRQVVAALLDVAQAAGNAAHVDVRGALVGHLVLVEPDEEEAIRLLRTCYAIHRGDDPPGGGA